MIPRRSLLVPALACAALAACADAEPMAVAPAPGAPAAARVADFVPGRVVVRYREGASLDRVRSRPGPTPLRVAERLLLPRTALLEVPVGREEALAAALSQDPEVEFAEPDYVIQVLPCEVGVCAETNDPFRGLKWDLHNPGAVYNGATFLQNTGRADADIDWQEMYDHLGPAFSGSAVISIIDTGVRATHNDLVGRVIGQRNFVTTDPAQVGNAADDNSHGTHVAGIAAAAGNNGFGLMGVAYGPNIRILAVKACNAAGSCPTSASANGIVWSVDNGANVVNLSLSGFGSATAGSALQRAALQYARANEVLPFCATGNDGNNPAYTGGIAFPARFPECVAVGATNWNDEWASYSNSGPGIDIAAPGGAGNPLGTPYSGVMSTLHTSNGIYGWKSGTSMATPQVAGLAALLFALGETDADAVLQRILDTADDIGDPGYDERTGWGRINAYRAVTGLDPDAPPTAEAGGPYAGDEGSPVAFDGSASADPNGKPIDFAWAFGDGAAGTGPTPAHAYADDGTYTVTLTTTDPAGLSRTGVATATIRNVAPAVTATIGVDSVASGGTVTAGGSFTDPGALDAPWSWSVRFDGGTATGTTAAQAPFSATGAVCGTGTRRVVVSVTDKDGGIGVDSLTVTATANPVTVTMPGAFNPRSNGMLPVRIRMEGVLDPAQVDLATVRFNGAPVAVKNDGGYHASIEAGVLVLHFERRAVAPNGGEFTLTATMRDGCRAVAGRTTARIVP